MASTIAVPHTQGVRSSTFKQPPLDCSLTLHEIYEWHAKHSPRHPLFIFEDRPGSTRTIVWEEAVRGIHRATRFIRDAVGPDIEVKKDGKAPVVSILATLDSITYFCFTVAAFRTGCALFPLSPRNSPTAILYLLRQTGSRHIFVSPDHANQSLAAEALGDLKSDFTVKILQTPVFEDLFPFDSEADETFIPEPAADVSIDDVAIIYHSSGTTSFPKPIYTNHSAVVRFGVIGTFGTVDFAGQVFGCHAVPLFHGMAAFEVAMAASCGITIGVFKPQSPPVVPNPVNTLEGILAVKTDYIFITPTFLETWAAEPDSLKKIASAKAIIYGGGPLSKEAGDTIVAHGSTLYSSYASTEAMHISNVISKPLGVDWEYFEISPARKFRLIEYGDNQYHLILLVSDIYRPNVINTSIDGVDAYATNDLMAFHPTRKELVKVVGRTDDQIMHSTGEKTNPGPLERMMMRDPHIEGAVMFGRGRFNCGILVSPKADFAFDPSNEDRLADFRSLIWPTIQSMNAYAPSHSRLFKEMVIVTSAKKPFLYTAKGTIRRQAIIATYEEEINAAYDAVDTSSQVDISLPADWNIESCRKFVREVFHKTLRSGMDNIDDERDVFEVGLDSLQATWIRNSIFHVLREIQPRLVRSIPSNFVYEHPTVNSLADYLSRIIKGDREPADDTVEAKRKELLSLVDKYTKHIPTQPVEKSRVDAGARVILLTGSTGSLGANILARLLVSNHISKVFTLSRPSSDNTDVMKRHVQAFEREGLAVPLLLGSKIRFLVGDPSQEGLGLEAGSYLELREEVTHIIHNAWRVNFNVSVVSFESNIRSVRNLADMCLSSGRSHIPRLLFISSIGVFKQHSGPFPAPETPLNTPDSAIGTGYGESKWVSERILQTIAESSALRPLVIRCGQMTGGRVGAWNDHEWFPSLVKSSIALKKLPSVEGSVSWISAYDAGGSIVDMLDADADVLHLVHPRPAQWNVLASAFAKLLELPLVSYDEWLADLEKAYASSEANPMRLEKDFQRIPALRLIEFFRAVSKNVSSEDLEPLGIAKLASERAQASSLTLRVSRRMCEIDVRLWIAFWEKTGFL